SDRHMHARLEEAPRRPHRRLLHRPEPQAPQIAQRVEDRIRDDGPSEVGGPCDLIRLQDEAVLEARPPFLPERAVAIRLLLCGEQLVRQRVAGLMDQNLVALRREPLLRAIELRLDVGGRKVRLAELPWRILVLVAPEAPPLARAPFRAPL